MERMDTLDAEFLHLEDGVAHMHIGRLACLPTRPRRWTTSRGLSPPR